MREPEIVLVDDEPDILDLLEKALNREGFFHIVKAADGHSAITACKKMDPGGKCSPTTSRMPARHITLRPNWRRWKQAPAAAAAPYSQAALQSWLYLIGFPYPVGKYMLYYNGETVGRLFPVFRMVLALAFGTVVTLFLAYGIWLTRQMGRITKGIGCILLRTYQPLPEKGVFRDVCTAMNKMDREMRHSDRVQAETERARREWIANITHDLKTPLSPVRGYAELLADGSAAESRTVREYGAIILKNVDHAEKLVNDLKLTYQLESGALPFYPGRYVWCAV